MKLDEKGGIEVYVAAEKPEGVAEENWLPQAVPVKAEDDELHEVGPIKAAAVG